MRIGIYNPRVGFSRAGGTETFLREIIKRLQDDHDIVLYCGAGELLDEVSELNITIEQLPLTTKESKAASVISSVTPLIPAEIESLTMYGNARRRNIFEQMFDEIDVLSTHYYLDNLLVSRTAPVPTLFHFPGIKEPSARWKAMAWIARTDVYLANSQATADRVHEWLDIDIDGIVYPGVDLQQFTSNVNPAFEEERTAILFVGRLDGGKGLVELLEAQAALGDRTRLYLVGDGTLEEDLRERVRELDIEDDVVFVGSVGHDDVPSYYVAADIFCLPSHHESFGMVNIEAMACGTPVVSTRIDAIEEYLTDGENGFLVDPGDTAALTDALERLVENDYLREEFAANGLECAREFGWKQQATQMEEHYRNAR